MRTITAVLLAVLSIAAAPLIPISKAKKGCTAVEGFATFSVVYEKVLIVAKREHAPDQPDELWVLYPDDPSKNPVDADGHRVTVNVLESSVLIDGEQRQFVFKHMTRICRCPPFFWRGGPAPTPNGPPVPADGAGSLPDASRPGSPDPTRQPR